MQAKRVRFPAVFQAEWQPLEIPKPAPHTVVAHTRHSLISAGTELAIYAGSHIGYSLPNPPFPLMPHYLGYALVGEIVACGEAARGESSANGGANQPHDYARRATADL